MKGDREESFGQSWERKSNTQSVQNHHKLALELSTLSYTAKQH